MMPIIENWKQYFVDTHEGIGTTYERFILNLYFDKIKERFSINSVLEVPSFGMTGISGINSLWWSASGVDVTILDDEEERIVSIREVWEGIPLRSRVLLQKNGYAELPFKDKSFDLGWNFASLWFVSDLNEFLRELSRVSRKAVFICVPNSNNIFNAFRLRGKPDNGQLYIENIKPERIKMIMKKNKWNCVEEGYLDCPPWPDIAMKKEDFFKNMGLSWLIEAGKKSRVESLCILDYFNGRKPDMKKQILKHSWLENLPACLKKYWAHHQYFIFIPKGGE